MSTLLLRLQKPLKSVNQADLSYPFSSPSVSAGNNPVARAAAGQATEADSLSAGSVAAEASAGFAQLEELFGSIRLAMHALGTRAQRDVGDLQRTAIEIAMLVAAKFLRAETEAGRLAIQETAKRLIETLDVSQRVTLYLHPGDLDALEDAIQQELTKNDISLVADPKLQPGECRADDGANGLISSLDLQLAELRQLLLENIEGGADAD